LNLLKGAACRVYFCGHDHFYDHLRADDGDGDPSNDIHQFVVGCGGAPLNTGSYGYNGTNTIWAPTRIWHEVEYGYVMVDIDGPVATLTWYHRTGADTYAPTTEVFSYSLAPVLTPTLTNGVLRMAWEGGGRLQSAPAVNGPWTTLTNAASPAIITELSTEALFYRVKLR
jgi:hypothetical protein